MPTKIDNSEGSTISNLREIGRRSTGELVALVNSTQYANDWEYYTSSDGSSWTQQWAPNLAAGASMAIDSTDRPHFIGQDVNTPSDARWHRYGSDDGTGTLVDEVAYSSKNTVEQASIGIDSTDTPWVVIQHVASVMGTNYRHLTLVERTGSTSWTEHGPFATGSVDHVNPTIAIDGNDDIHISWNDETNLNVYWDKFDTSTGSFNGNEKVTGAANAPATILIDPSTNEPIVDDADGAMLHKRTSGTWSHGSSYTTQILQGNVSISRLGTDIAVVWEKNGNIHYNTASAFDQFDSSAYTTLVSNSSTLGSPSTRWSFNNNNSPSPDKLDIVYHDSTNSDLYYASVSAKTASVTTDAASNITATDAQLNGTLSKLSGYSSADVYFEWRQSGASTWNTTTAQTLSSTGSFSDTISGLSRGTTYEFRAVSSTTDGNNYGDTLTFTTTDPTFSGTVTLSGSGVQNATVYVINDTTGAMEGSTTTDSSGNYTVQVASGNGSDTFHVAAEYEDSNGNQYNATSEPYVTPSKTIDFAVDSYTPPSASNVNFDVTSVTKASDAWQFNTSVNLYNDAFGVAVNPAETYFAVISSAASVVEIYPYGDWGSLSGSSDAVQSFAINGQAGDSGSPSVTFSPDGNWLVAPVDKYNGTSGETRMFIWDTSASDPTNWTESSFLNPTFSSTIRAAAVDRTNSFVAVTGDSDTQIYEVDTGNHVGTLTTGGSIGVNFSPTQDILAVGGANGYCRLYNVGDSSFSGWSSITTLDVNNSGSYQSLYSIAFSPNNNWMGIGTMDGTMHLYSVGSTDGTGWNEVSGSPHSITAYATAVAFDSQENYFAGTAGIDPTYSGAAGDVHIRTVSEMNQEAHLNQTSTAMESVALQDTDLLYTGQDGTLYIHQGPYQ